MSRTKLLPLIISMTLRRPAHKGGHTHDIAISCYLEDRGEVGSRSVVYSPQTSGTNRVQTRHRWLNVGLHTAACYIPVNSRALALGDISTPLASHKQVT